MSPLIELYNQILLKVKAINDEIQKVQVLIEKKSESAVDDSSARILKLEEQLVKIDDYLEKVKGFQMLAKKNMDSQNVLTIEAPLGYRVNLNKLRDWAQLIDPTSPNDPYAQRVFAVAKCDECFLEKKKVEFKERIEQLQLKPTVGEDDELRKLKKEVVVLQEKLKKYAMSEEVSGFATQVIEENKKYWYKNAPETFNNLSEPSQVISPGAYAASLPFDMEQKIWLKNIMGESFDVEGGRVLLPLEINNRSEYVITITCAPARRKRLDKALQNFVLETINEAPADSRKVVVIDGVRYNSTSMESLRQLEGSFVMTQIPRNPDQLTTTLEELVSSFADIDESIEQYDSVVEYNDSVDISKRIALTTLILFGWPSSYEGKNRELIQRIMTNYERYGISIITVDYKNAEPKEILGRNVMPEYAMQNAIHISMLPNETTVMFADGTPKRFTWYTLQEDLPASFVENLLKNEKTKDVVGNEYTKRYSLETLPSYVREYKKIELPFGIDAKDEAHSISFENENFATYLVGASRSGKSTLLHTLIAGLIRNYHPDNVELWLADFKQLEFKKYITHCPPHIKYILLDESMELVYDLIDKLTNEMLERQKLFARLGVERIDQVDPTTLESPLPVIFVILDEFSIMSQSIAESPIYKLRLQNILAKGAALGIKFLFSSQTFTTGIAGLTATARAQIQQRIAMKGSKEEISETLELSSNIKTEQVNNWMEALPPHYALVKFRISADTLPKVKRYLVMYFDDYTPRNQMIEKIKGEMKPIEGYNPFDVTTYKDKHPVLVDGNTYDLFSPYEFSEFISAKKKLGKDELSEEEMLISFGTPRLMEKIKPAILTEETKENILLISREAELACTASILLSSMKSFMIQGGQVQIWAYEKNRLYRTYKQVFIDSGINVIEGMDSICDEIVSLKKSIQQKQNDKKLIVLIGMDRICMDFDYVKEDSDDTKKKASSEILEIRKDFEKKGAVVKSDLEEKLHSRAMAWNKRRRELKASYKEAGKSPEEIAELLKEELIKFNEMNEIPDSVQNNEHEEEPSVEITKSEQNKEEFKEHKSGAYDASDDFVYVIKQGSRLGVHFLLNLTAYSDVKACGLKREYFRHKLSFQISVADSRDMFDNKIASTLPEHICQYDNTLESFSFRPYLHKGIGWDGWEVNEDGQVINPYKDNK